MFEQSIVSNILLWDETSNNTYLGEINNNGAENYSSDSGIIIFIGVI